MSRSLALVLVCSTVYATGAPPDELLSASTQTKTSTQFDTPRKPFGI